MVIPNNKHIEFYEWQIQVLEDEWERYAKSPMRILMQEKRLFVGRIWGVQEEQGNVILRFKAGIVPRMKQPYLLCLVGSDAPQDSSNWNFNYTTFRSHNHLDFLEGIQIFIPNTTSNQTIQIGPI
ncbi:MAG: hypothetical protein IPH20_14505 [Bacteroidales bacterium]|nr:hypothetical protein [Bacteroidales bacterium]